MQQESRTKVTVRTSTILRPYLRAALIRSLISEWSQQEQIEVLRAMLTEVSSPKRPSVKELNDEFQQRLDERDKFTDGERDQATRCPYD